VVIKENRKHVYDISVPDVSPGTKEEIRANRVRSKLTLVIRSRYGSKDETFEPYKVSLEL
jgi:hypothetical protein